MNSKQRLTLSKILSRLNKLDPSEVLPIPEGTRSMGTAFRIGITGPLGVGKSTLINQLLGAYRARELTVGVIAVDPTSPFTGGALLGDRIRMADSSLDDGVFVRSLATRGASGGLAVEAIDAADIMDVFGFDRIIIETVGVGQSEVDIAGACDVTCVVFDPGSGDSIQAMKAGLMEIADLFIVNKKDKQGADRFILDLASILELKPNTTRPEILATSANRGEGVPELCEWLESNFREVTKSGSITYRRKLQRTNRIRKLAEDIVVRRMWNALSDDDLLKTTDDSRQARQAAIKLVKGFLNE